jgi:hypothetical protein
MKGEHRSEGRQQEGIEKSTSTPVAGEKPLARAPSTNSSLSKNQQMMSFSSGRADIGNILGRWTAEMLDRCLDKLWL